MDLFLQFLGNTGFGLADWRNLVMIVVGACFVYLAIAKKYELICDKTFIAFFQ